MFEEIMNCYCDYCYEDAMAEVVTDEDINFDDWEMD